MSHPIYSVIQGGDTPFNTFKKKVVAQFGMVSSPKKTSSFKMSNHHYQGEMMLEYA